MANFARNPNSLANLKVGGRTKQPVKDLGKKIRGFDAKSGKPIFEILFRILHDEKREVKDRLRAAEILLNRGWGRAIETVIVEEINPADHALREYTLEELKSMRNVMVVEGSSRPVMEYLPEPDVDEEDEEEHDE